VIEHDGTTEDRKRKSERKRERERKREKENGLSSRLHRNADTNRVTKEWIQHRSDGVHIAWNQLGTDIHRLFF